MLGSSVHVPVPVPVPVPMQQQVPSSPISPASLPQFVVTQVLTQRYDTGPAEQSFLDVSCISLTPGIMTPEQTYSVTLPIGIKPRPETQAQLEAAADNIFRFLNDRIWVGFDTKICYEILVQYFASIGVQSPSPVSMIDARNLVPLSAPTPPSLADIVSFFRLPEQRLYTARGESELILELLQRCSLNTMLNTHYLESVGAQPLQQESAANSMTARKSEPYEEVPNMSGSPMQGQVQPMGPNGSETAQFAVDTKEDRAPEEPQLMEQAPQRQMPAMKPAAGQPEPVTGREEHKDAVKTPQQGVTPMYGRQPTPPMTAQHYMALEAQMDPQMQAAQARVEAQLEIGDVPQEMEPAAVQAPTNGYTRPVEEAVPEYVPEDVEPQPEEPEEPRGMGHTPQQVYEAAAGQPDMVQETRVPVPQAQVLEQETREEEPQASQAQMASPPRQTPPERRDDTSDRSRTPSASVSERGSSAKGTWKNLVKKGPKTGAGKSPKKVKTSAAFYGPKAKPPRPQPVNPNYKGNNYDPNYQQRFRQGYQGGGQSGYQTGYQSAYQAAGGYQAGVSAAAAQAVPRGPPPKTLKFPPTTKPEEIRKRIDEAIQSRATIWMRYNGGMNPGIPRGVSMRSWHNQNRNAFFGVPHKSRTGDESKFFLNQVLEVRCWHWRVERPEDQSSTRRQYQFDKTQSRYGRGGKAPRGRRPQQ